MGAITITYINKFISFLVWPFSFLPAWLGLFLLSALAGIALLWIYGKVSNQAKIREVKSRIYSALLESILFRNDIWLCLKAQAKMFGFGARYFSLALFPVFILAIPCIFLLSELNQQYASKSLSPDSETIVKLTLTDTSKLYDVKLNVPTDVQVTPPVRIPATKEIFWKLKAKEAGDKNLNFQIADFNLAKTLFVGSKQQDVGAIWESAWSGKLLYPTAPASLPYVQSLVINYPEQLYSLCVFDTNWLIFFLVFSMLSGILVSKSLGIAI